MANPQLILDYYLSRQEESDAVPLELKRVRAELVQVQKQDQRLLDAYPAQIIQLDELASRREALAQHHLVLENHLSELEKLVQQQAR